MKSLKYFLLLLLVSCSGPNNQERNPASEEEPPRVNPLIDNREAMIARSDVWNNPDATRIFLSTFEFEEDIIGLSQIKWAVEQAQAGKIVDIVLDDAGHKLSDEVLLYMVESGVNLHVFSPMWSWRGFKARLSRQQGVLPITSRIKAIWRQLTYRMHDKILINFVAGEPTGGQVILGGRNARDSHYGIDMRAFKSTRKEGGKIVEFANQALEYEHEVMVHSRLLHQQVETYVNDFLESSFTERLNVKKLRERLVNSRAYAKKNGPNWQTKIAEDKAKYNDDFRSFSRDIKAWLTSYGYYFDGKNTDSSGLAKKLLSVFENNEKSLTALIKENAVNIKEIDRILAPIYGEGTSGTIRAMVGNFQNAGSVSASDISNAFTSLIKEGQKTIAHNIEVKSLSVDHFAQLLGPAGADNAGILTKIGRGIRNTTYGIGFDFVKYDSLKKYMNEAYSFFQEYQARSKNWKAAAIEVDSVNFLHDTVDDLAFRKKSMDELYKFISNCREECVWNSQYGSLTEEAQNAIDNVIKKNSAIYRFVQNEYHRAGGGLDASIGKAEMISRLVQDNVSHIETVLTNPNIPSSELIKDKKELARQFTFFFKEVPRAEEQAKNLGAQLEKGSLAPALYAQAIADLIDSNTEGIGKSIYKDPDVLQRVLLKLRGYVDYDPNEILGKWKMIKFYFMTNDIESWAVGFDKPIHADFHYNIMKKFRKMGPGLQVVGFNGSGRIHSKVAVTERGVIVSSMNADPRSEKFNTEVGVEIRTGKKGKEVTAAFKDHIGSYMHTQRHHIINGQMVRERQCFTFLDRVVRRIMAPIL